MVGLLEKIRKYLVPKAELAHDIVKESWGDAFIYLLFFILLSTLFSSLATSFTMGFSVGIISFIFGLPAMFVASLIGFAIFVLIEYIMAKLLSVGVNYSDLFKLTLYGSTPTLALNVILSFLLLLVSPLGLLLYLTVSSIGLLFLFLAQLVSLYYITIVIREHAKTSTLRAAALPILSILLILILGVIFLATIFQAFLNMLRGGF